MPLPVTVALLASVYQELLLRDNDFQIHVYPTYLVLNIMNLVRSMINYSLCTVSDVIISCLTSLLTEKGETECL